MVGADETMELWRPPNSTRFVIIVLCPVLLSLRQVRFRSKQFIALLAPWSINIRISVSSVKTFLLATVKLTLWANNILLLKCSMSQPLPRYYQHFHQIKVTQPDYYFVLAFEGDKVVFCEHYFSQEMASEFSVKRSF